MRVREAVAGPLIAIASLTLGGCMADRVPGQSEGREYKGPADPAIMELSPEAEAALAERFERVQAR